jgi:hypothetical protein
MSAVAPRAQRSSARRTITGIGLFLLEAIPLGLVGFILAWITDGLGIVFQLVFIGLAAYGALRVRRRDLLAAFIVPPLAYAAAIVIASPALGITGGLIVGLATNVGSFLAVGAPWLFLGTAIAFGIAVWRGRTGR